MMSRVLCLCASVCCVCRICYGRFEFKTATACTWSTGTPEELYKRLETLYGAENASFCDAI
jgi:hypothetical protein|eukprot:COSAG06_NODE_774_length_12424_cov_35.268014_10_plen_61_part_00